MTTYRSGIRFLGNTPELAMEFNQALSQALSGRRPREAIEFLRPMIASQTSEKTGWKHHWVIMAACPPHKVYWIGPSCDPDDPSERPPLKVLEKLKTIKARWLQKRHMANLA